MDRYERRKQESMYWFNKSSDLRASAAALWMSTESDLSRRIVEECHLGGGFIMGAAVVPVFHMLCGMAMELIFKALVVEKLLTVNESHHDLLQHASMAGITYSERERQLLKILTHSITWAGRYPTPTPKRKDYLEDYSNLISENLYDRVPLGAGTVLRPNEALNWDSFNLMWSKAMSAYFKEKET